jgi:hypothetical protein
MKIADPASRLHNGGAVSTKPTLDGSQAAVATVVVADSVAGVSACLAAVGQQVYGSAQVFVVGGDARMGAAAQEHGALWRRNWRGVIGSLAPEAVFVWVLSDCSRPRSDALGVLVRESSRVEASVAGCKVVDAQDQDLLVSVGYATDVFDVPYSGLQAGEVDQEQYDVIRDVASVSAASLLVRRDLFLGLGGPDPLLASAAGAVDLCQRARLLGGRIVVVPSAEVLYEGRDRVASWRERAGEIRAMLKVYSLVTLLWAVPLAFLSGAVESVAGPFLGRWPLFGFLGAWLWNIVYFPSTLLARWRARRGRVVGDEEIFRYQTGGSVRLKALYEDGVARLKARFPEGILAGFSEAVQTGQQRLRRPAVVVAMLVVLLALMASRSILFGGLPAVGYSLPPPESGAAALGAYSGGWNPAGLGSPDVLRPEVAATALAQTVLFGKAGLAVAALTLGAFLAGCFGMARLLRLWGVGQVPGYLAGAVLMAGPAAAAIAGDGNWAAMISLGVLPWAVGLPLSPWPPGWFGRAAKVAGVGLATGVVGIFAPAALPVPLAAVLLWAATGRGRRWPGVLLSLSGTLLALPLLLPWVAFADLGSLYASGAAAFWQPSWVFIAAGAALLATVAAGDRDTALVAGWGGVVAVAGAALARAGDFGLGREARAAGLAAVALGVAAVAGAALEAGGRRREFGGVRRLAGVVGALGAVVLVVATVAVALPGRAGLPEDRYRDLLAFAVGDGPVTSRVLLFGPANDLPGESRDLEGLGYRVLSPPYPRSWETYLNAPRLGDEALDRLLRDLLAGKVRRAGEALAGFGIGWVAFTEASPLQTVFDAQLDMVALRGLDMPTYRSEVATAVAMGSDGSPWTPTGTGFRRLPGAVGASVALAVNADFRWGPGDWEQTTWRSRVEGAGEVVRFAGNGARRDMAGLALAWLALLVAVSGLGSWLGRRR